MSERHQSIEQNLEDLESRFTEILETIGDLYGKLTAEKHQFRDIIQDFASAREDGENPDPFRASV